MNSKKKEFDSNVAIWNDINEKWEVQHPLKSDPHYQDGFI